jgi:hypothetical protein
LLKQSLGDDAKIDVLHYALQLCFHHPVLIPLLESLLQNLDKNVASEYTPQLQELARQNSLFHRSDGIVWALHYLNMFKADVGDEIVKEIIKTQDSLAILMLYLLDKEKYKANVIEFMYNIVSGGDNYEIDQHWLLLYQLYLDAQIQNPYPDEDGFAILKNAGVSFIEIQ